SELQFLLESMSEPVPMKFLSASGDALLSARELDVVRCVAEGLSNREIAQRLSLREHTVKNYLFRIFDKLGVSSRVEVVLYALGSGNGGGSQPTTSAGPQPVPGPRRLVTKKLRESDVGAINAPGRPGTALGRSKGPRA